MFLLKSELLSPAGDLNRLKTAILYGADSIYIGTPDLSLRSKSTFSLDDIREGVEFVKKHGKKIYMAMNIFTHNSDIEKLPMYLDFLKEVQPHGLIVADPAIFHYLRTNVPEIPLHISTQANVCSYLSVDFWQKQGADTVVLAREMNFNEIKEIKEKSPNINIETFVHGAICMTYSGRCLLSNYMSERGSNQGSCAHNCRWNYKVKFKLKEDKIFELDINDKNQHMFDFVLEEEFRPEEYYAIEEDEMGSYILNSKDLCLLTVLNEYLEIGIDKLKIEGRHKSEYYTGVVTKAYRYAMDAWEKDPENWDPAPYLAELMTVSNRGYSLAFHGGRLTNMSHNYNLSKTLSSYVYAGQVSEINSEYLVLVIKNYLVPGDILEFVSPHQLEPIRLRLYEFIDNRTLKVKEKCSPGEKNAAIRIPLDKFNNMEVDEVLQLIPELTVVRKSNPDETKHLDALRFNKTSLAAETGASSKVMYDIESKKSYMNKNNLKNVSAKQKINVCCGKGCNGCLEFWHDDSYKDLRELLLNDKKKHKL